MLSDSNPQIDLESAPGRVFKQSSILNVTYRKGLHISFKDICLQITLKKKTKPILRSVSGQVSPARLTAILGPTGSGKTSLLNVLAARIIAVKGVVLTGEVKVGGVPISDWHKYRRETAYVEQDDLMFSNLTVMETISLAAELRLPRDLTPSERADRVQAVIQELGLKRVVDTFIGNAKVRGVSGGERKRVSIACEILNQPSVFFLDEPTSGLDAFQALRVVTTLKELAVQGRTIVTSIHQPRSAIFALFDEVLVMSEGRLMYAGPAKDLSSYLSECGYPLPAEYNPADYCLDLMSLDLRTDLLERETRARLDGLHSSFAARSKKDDDSTPASGQIRLADLTREHKFQAAYTRQFYLLTQRALRQKRRDKRQVVIPFFMSCFFGFLLGFIYYRTGTDLGQTAIQDKVGFMFFLIVNQAFMGLLGTISTFPAERDIVTRERAANSYAVGPYYLSKVLADLPSLFFPFLLTTIAYWLAYLSPSGVEYIILCVITMMTYECSSALGLLLSASTATPEAAMGMGQPVNLVFMLFSGFYANTSLIPAALAWIQWISPVRYAFGAAVVNILADLTFTCLPSQVGNCITNGQAQLARMSMENDTVSRDLGILAGLIVFFLLAGYTCLRVKKTKYLHPKQAE